MKLMDTSIPVNYAQLLKVADDMLEFTPSHTDRIYEIVFVAISDFLGLMKSKDKKVALTIRDLKGNFKMAGVVGYHKNENEDMPGNWSYELTFDAEDIKDATEYMSYDTQFQRVLGNTAMNLYTMKFVDPMYVPIMIEALVTAITNWLDVNAKDNEEVVLELAGYFTAAVGIENGVKVMSITPDGALKRLVKSDSALEV